MRKKSKLPTKKFGVLKSFKALVANKNKTQFFFVRQTHANNCGIACLLSVLYWYDKRKFEMHKHLLQKKYTLNREEGITLTKLIEVANEIGFDTLPVKLTVEELINFDIDSPIILHWNGSHYVVLFKVTNTNLDTHIQIPQYQFIISDPAIGIFRINYNDFVSSWYHQESKGVALFLEGKNFN